MSFPPTVGAQYQTLEGRIWTVTSVEATGLERAAWFSTNDRDVAEQHVLEEEWDAFAATVREIT